MTREPTEEEIDTFDQLVPRAAEHRTFTWCNKRQEPIFTEDLRGEECLRCEYDLDQGGICDPL